MAQQTRLERPNEQQLQQILLKQRHPNLAQGGEQGGAFPLLSSSNEDLSAIMAGPDNIKKKAITELLVAQHIRSLAAIILAATVTPTTITAGTHRTHRILASRNTVEDKKLQDYRVEIFTEKDKKNEDGPEEQLLKEINEVQKVLNRLQSELDTATISLADAYQTLDQYLQDIPAKLDQQYIEQLNKILESSTEKEYVSKGMEHNGVRINEPKDLLVLLHENARAFFYKTPTPEPTKDTPTPEPRLSREQEREQFVTEQIQLVARYVYRDIYQEEGTKTLEHSDFATLLRLTSTRVLELRDDLRTKTEVVQRLNQGIIDGSRRLDSLQEKQDAIIRARKELAAGASKQYADSEETGTSSSLFATPKLTPPKEKRE